MQFRFLSLALGLLIAVPLSVQADYSESFEDITTLGGKGWVEVNNSDAANLAYFQGNDAVFPANSGNPTEYLGVNFNSTSGSVISNWMIMQEDTLDNGMVFSFFTRTVTGSTFPDRLEVRLSTNGASTDVGSAPTDLGDFTELLIEVNPNLEGPAPAGYPDTWTEFTATLSGLAGPTQGRLAFRYFVTDAGPAGANSNYIGIDDVSLVAVPEPTSMIFLTGMGLCSLVVRRKRS